MAIILNNKKSTYSGPNGYYTVETTNITNRTQTTVDISFKVTVNLGNSESLSGTGRPLTGGLYLQGNWYTFTIKNSSTSWKGTTKHYINTTITVTGLTPTQSSITGVQFRSLGSSPSSTYGAILTATNCSDIEIPIGHRNPLVNGISSITENNQVIANTGIESRTIVAGMSQKSFYISATAYDNATITKYYIKIGDKVYESNTNPVTIDFSTEQVNVDGNGEVLIYPGVQDSMGLTTLLSGDAYFICLGIPYTKPTLAGSTTAKRNGQLTGKVRLNISGTYFDGQIGNVTNDITINYIIYDIASSSSTVYTINNASITKSNGTFTVTNYEIGSTNPNDVNYFNPLKQYTVEIYVDDAFNTTRTSKRITKGTPVWTEYADRVHFEKITANNIACFSCTGSITWSNAWSWETLPITIVDINKVGFTINNSTIYVPDNVNKIKVSVVSSMYNVDIGGDKSFALYKNDVNETNLCYINYTTSSSYTNASGFAICNVSSGDALKIRINSGNAGTMRIFESTRIYIEVID